MQDCLVKNSERKRLFGNIRWIIFGGLASLCGLVVGLIVHWQPVKTVKRQQAALIRAIEARKPAKFRRLLASNYADRWRFSPADLSEAMLDVSSQFLAMRITPEDFDLVLTGTQAVVTTRLNLGGSPMGGGVQIAQMINRLEEPFVFNWEKQNFLSSSWRLVSVENPAIPDNAWNYVPGSIRGAMKGGDF